MSELGRRGSSKRKNASQNHLKQRTLFDHFLVTRKTTPDPTPARPNDLKDDEPDSQTIFGQTDTVCCPSTSASPGLPSAERANDTLHIVSSPHGSSVSIHSTIVQNQERCSVHHEHVPPLSTYEPSSAAGSSPIDVDLVAGSDSPKSVPCSPVSSPTSCRYSSHVVDLTIEEGTVTTPIFIEGSPIHESPSLTRTSSWHTPFQHPPLEKRKQPKNNSPEAPFPNASMQHIRGSVTDIQVKPINLARRWRRTSQSPPDPNPSLPFNEAQNVDKISNKHARSYHHIRSSEHQADMNPILNYHSDPHPAISSISGLASELQDAKEAFQQHWVQKWRPLRAEHILGNEKNAGYLREWMHALRLHFDTGSSSTIKSTKSRRNYRKRKRRDHPEVVREVTRKRRTASGLDGWIVDDDDDDSDHDFNKASDGFEDFEDWPLPSSCDPREPPPIFFGKKIRNTILLVGPPGCGKTAAVYACAEELGWNVFEVHSGLGRRGGTHLDDLIGDVGRNHTLPQPLLFHRGRSEPPSPVKRRSTNAVNIRDELPGTEIHPQSAVLIEEADVVFTDEVGFWPSVIAFIRDSRRPVIITCNDVSLIPVETLPLQAILTFSSPPTSLTWPLLSAICKAEGRPTPEPKDIPRLEGQVATVDLRQLISQCQLGLAYSNCENPGQQSETSADVIFSLRVKAEIPAVMEPESDGRRNLCLLQQSLRGADLASYLDACVLLSYPHGLEVTENHSDDQVGYKALKVTQRPAMPVQAEFYSRDVDLGTAALRSFEGKLQRCFPGMPLDSTCEMSQWPSREQYRRRVWEGLRTDPALEGLVDLPRLYLDYRPLIGVMVMVEDKEIEKAAERVKGRSGRQTQNSQKRQEDDVRWLNAREELRGAVRAGGLAR